MNSSLFRRALLLGLSILATLTVSAQTISPYYEPLSYTPLFSANPTINGTTWGTATKNDCLNSPAKFHGQNVIYVSPNGTDYASSTVPYVPGKPLQSGAGANAIVNPGQLVCFETGTYWPFTINKSGTSYTNLVRFEVVPGDIAKIDLQNCPSTTEPCWQYNANTYYGIQIAPPTPTGSVKYVLVSGFYVQGPDEYLSGVSTSYTDATSNLVGATATSPGYPSGYYNAACIGINGNQGENKYAANGEADHIYIVANIAAGCSGGGIGAAFADYVTIDGNIVYDNNWYGVYGGSAISIGDSLDTNPNDSAYPNSYPHTYKNYIVNNTVFNNIQFEPASSGAGFSAPGSLNDGEGIVIDTNLNSSANPNLIPAGICAGSSQSYCTAQAYSGWTLISNNQVWGNGSSGIEATYSWNIDITFNTTFNNGVNQNEKNRAEITDFDSMNITVASNLMYTSGFDTSFSQGYDGGPTPGSIPFYAQNYPYLAIVHYDDNTALSNFQTPPTFLDAYPPIQSNNNGDHIIFANNAYAFGGAPQGSPYYGEYATDPYTVYNTGGLALAPTSDPLIQNSYTYMGLTTDIQGTPRPPNQLIAAGAFVVAK